jgi:hypothetical protein
MSENTDGIESLITTSITPTMATVIKFHKREIPERQANNKRLLPVRTRTCMKIGLVDERWVAPEGISVPKEEEWWLVHIVHETQVGSNRGCFIMRPVKKIDNGSILRLLPGFFVTSQPNPGTLIVTPKDHQHAPWILPLKLKQEFMSRMGLSSVVVNLGGGYWYKEPVIKAPSQENGHG